MCRRSILWIIETLLFLGLLFWNTASIGQAAAPQDGVRWHWRTANDGYWYSSEIVSIADQNGDGIRDVLISCPHKMVFWEDPRLIFVSGSDGELIRIDEHHEPLERYGLGLGNAGDADGDGVDDYAIGNPDFRGGYGKVEVKSGVDGSLIYEWAGIEPSQGLGYRVGGVGDVDGDGRDDLAFSGGRLFITSGRTKEILRRFPSGNFCRANDLNSDGFNDVVVAYPLATPNGNPVGEVVAYSGHDGQELWRTEGPWHNSNFGMSIASIGDLDGDGAGELLIGAPHYDNRRGGICMLEGATGQIIQQYFGYREKDRFGTSVCGPGDMNGDGIPDYAMGAMQRGVRYPTQGRGYVVAFSGADHHQFFLATGALKSRFGFNMSAIGDINQDGQADLAISSPGWSNPWIDAWGFNTYLTASASNIKASATEPVEFHVTFPATEALRPYRILLSHSGVGPTSINGFEIPLSWDNLLNSSLSGQIPPLSNGFAGQLDGFGRAYAQLTGGPHLARWPGARLYFAAVSFEIIGSSRIGKLTSVPLTLEIDP